MVYTKLRDGNYTFDYFANGKGVRLNDLAPPTWRFFPVDSNFRIFLRENWRVLPSPEIHFSIPGIRFPGLGKDELSILAALHEIGHANLENRLLSLLASDSLDGLTDGQIHLQIFRKPRICVVPEYVPKIPELKVTYAEQIHESHCFFNQWYGYEEFSERYAWAYAFRTVRKQRILEQYDIKDFRHFYVPCLTDYNEIYISKFHRAKYSYRWHPNPFPWIIRREQRSWIKSN